jgi:acyl dehydratase
MNLTAGQQFTSPWIAVTRDRIRQFADATDDHQWIHLDPEKAIAHGFLTLSLISSMLREAFKAEVRMAINYGVNRVRFTEPVPADARLRGRFTAKEVAAVKDALKVTWDIAIDREGAGKPCCLAEWIVLYYQ